MNASKKPLHVLVLVGTDHHPFGRLVELADSWFTRQRGSDVALTCHIQYGTTLAPRNAQGSPYLQRSQMDSELVRADMVICHGGPSTIVEVLRHGKLPLVMPRDPHHGEHVDGHQQRFAVHMQRRGLIFPVATAEDFDEGLAAVRDGSHSRILAEIEMPSPAVSALRLGGLVQRLLERNTGAGSR